jgi:hypothetical protein
MVQDPWGREWRDVTGILWGQEGEELHPSEEKTHLSQRKMAMLEGSVIFYEANQWKKKQMAVSLECQKEYLCLDVIMSL